MKSNGKCEIIDNVACRSTDYDVIWQIPVKKSVCDVGWVALYDKIPFDKCKFESKRI